MTPQEYADKLIEVAEKDFRAEASEPGVMPNIIGIGENAVEIMGAFASDAHAPRIVGLVAMITACRIHLINECEHADDAEQVIRTVEKSLARRK